MHNLSCEECGLTLLGLESQGDVPLEHDECPDCGSTEFTPVE